VALTGITIDSPETRDIDDGIWIERVGSGWLLTTVIADVSAHLRPGGSIDAGAFARVASRYFRNGNRPMLPRGLSENKMSLLPEKKRRVITARISITDRFETKLESLSLEGFKSKGRIDYPAIPEAIEAESPPEAKMLAAVAQGLLDKRRNQGALVVYDLLDGWVTTEEGFLKQMKDVRETIGYIIIQEAMILTNSLIAEWCVKEDIPVLFRNHTARAATPPLAEIGQQIQAAIKGPWQDMDLVRKRIHMLLDRADYGPVLKGHYGLSLPAYLHFTSPIRRYADLVNHRQIRAKLTDKPFEYTQEDLRVIAEHINLVEQAERDGVKELFKAKAEDKAEKALEKGRFSRLNDKEFERILKVGTRSGEDASEALVEEFLARLKANILQPICMTVACFFGPDNPPETTYHPGWKKIRDAVLQRLQEKPEEAVTLWTMAATITEVSPIEYTEESSGPPHAPVFAAKAKSGLFLTGWVGANTAKLARQRAAVALLFHFHGLPSPSFLVFSAPESVAKKPIFLGALAEGRDPIVALQEYSQKNKLTLPSYTFKQEGPSHTPIITCTCSFNGRAGVGSANNKQEAKRRAAKELVDRLLQEPSMRASEG
jgi:ribonuclease R